MTLSALTQTADVTKLVADWSEGTPSRGAVTNYAWALR
jgi:hypothetical protein